VGLLEALCTSANPHLPPHYSMHGRFAPNLTCAKPPGAFQFQGKYGKIGGNLEDGGTEMKRTREQIKAELTAKFEEQVDQILDWQEQADRPTLTEFKEQVLKTRKELSQELVAAFLRGEEGGVPAERPACPRCGGPMENKGKQPKLIEARVRSILLEREYFYCPACTVYNSPKNRNAPLSTEILTTCPF